jgi:dihydrolipoamide dehydrogenase
VARVIAEVDELRHDWGVEYPPPKLDVNKIRARKEKVISSLSGGLKQLAKRRNVKVIHARGTFQDSTTLKLEGDDASIPEDRTLTYDYCILATGSTPAMPSAFNIGSDRVMDSTGALDLADLPESLLVIGGGYIGLEMGTVYANLGSKVSVVELMEGLLPGADRDLVKPLHKRLNDAVWRADLSQHQGRLDWPPRQQGRGRFRRAGQVRHRAIRPGARLRRPASQQ